RALLVVEPRHRAAARAGRGHLRAGEEERPRSDGRGDPRRRARIRARHGGSAIGRTAPRARVAAPAAPDWADRHIPAYLDHLAVERGLARASVEAYRRDLTAFAAWLVGSGLPARPDREALRRYLRFARSKGLSSRSAARALSALRGFFAF